MVIDTLKKEGVEIGLFRPITLFPYPYKELCRISDQKETRHIFDVEMNTGQMIDDVRLATLERKPITFYGRQGGIVPSPEEIVEQLRKLL